LGEEELVKIANLAGETRALLVTGPSLAVVEGPLGPLILSLGIGSLVFHPKVELPLDGYLVLRRREWIDGCYVESVSDPVTLGSPHRRRSGVIIAVDPRDPAAMLINGLHIDVELSSSVLEGEIVKATLEGEPVLGIREGRYVIHVLGGEAYKRLSYITRLLGGCRGGLQ